MNRLYLHVANVNIEKPVKVSIEINHMKVKGGIAHEIYYDPQLEITEMIPDAFEPVTKQVCGAEWEFPAASVTAMEFDIS